MNLLKLHQLVYLIIANLAGIREFPLQVKPHFMLQSQSREDVLPHCCALFVAACIAPVKDSSGSLHSIAAPMPYRTHELSSLSLCTTRLHSSILSLCDPKS